MNIDKKALALANGRPHYARKRFGQNFLHDENVIRKIVDSISAVEGDHLLEIGPGLGALTKELAKTGATIHCVELDADLAKSLRTEFQEYDSIKIIEGDALKFDLSSIATEKRPLRVIGNLPYNISTPIIFHLLKNSELIRDMTFMLQLEVIQRMISKVGKRNYGRLSLMVQYYCQVEHLFNVPSSAFSPKPRVVSALARLKPHSSTSIRAKDSDCLQTVVRTAFNQRRKTLRNSLRTIIPEALLDRIAINKNLRPQDITLNEYVEISNAICNHTAGPEDYEAK
jgi:16S rRNA (adenine1518-N6/adenine1519-N6)-dimethyltransferase